MTRFPEGIRPTIPRKWDVGLGDLPMPGCEVVLAPGQDRGAAYRSGRYRVVERVRAYDVDAGVVVVYPEGKPIDPETRLPVLEELRGHVQVRRRCPNCRHVLEAVTAPGFEIVEVVP